MSDLAVYPQQQLQTVPVREIQQRIEAIDMLMKSVMKKNVHYGVIPGTSKPTLYKAGAEKILALFNLVAASPEVEDLSTDDYIRYRVRTPILLADGSVRSVGVGECSSSEEKYAWRRSLSDEEWDSFPPDQRRIVYKKARNVYTVKQCKVNPHDQANTVLKMAHKRSFIASILLATGCSDIFDQDMEDIKPVAGQDNSAPDYSKSVKPARNDAPPPDEDEPMTEDADQARQMKMVLSIESKLGELCEGDIERMDAMCKDITKWGDKSISLENLAGAKLGRLQHAMKNLAHIIETAGD